MREPPVPSSGLHTMDRAVTNGTWVSTWIYSWRFIPLKKVLILTFHAKEQAKELDHVVLPTMAFWPWHPVVLCGNSGLSLKGSCGMEGT